MCLWNEWIFIIRWKSVLVRKFDWFYLHTSIDIWQFNLSITNSLLLDFESFIYSLEINNIVYFQSTNKIIIVVLCSYSIVNRPTTYIHQFKFIISVDFWWIDSHGHIFPKRSKAWYSILVLIKVLTIHYLYTLGKTSPTMQHRLFETVTQNINKFNNRDE